MMENGGKTWIVHDWDLDISAPLVRVVVRAGTMQELIDMLELTDTSDRVDEITIEPEEEEES